MKQYTNRTAIVLYLNLLVGFLYGLEEFEIINLTMDSYAYLIPVAFFSTFVIWNALLIIDKNK